MMEVKGHGPFEIRSVSFARHCCPYGRPGDRLWVRERWLLHHGANWASIRYGADGLEFDVPRYRDACDSLRSLHAKWRPSIFMPKWAARIWLTLTDVRVERLWDMTPEDMLAEGLPMVPTLPGDWVRRWDSINGKKFPYDNNPWVWALTFTVEGSE
jgi:hypothetical protein